MSLQDELRQCEVYLTIDDPQRNPGSICITPYNYWTWIERDCDPDSIPSVHGLYATMCLETWNHSRTVGDIIDPSRFRELRELILNGSRTDCEPIWFCGEDGDVSLRISWWNNDWLRIIGDVPGRGSIPEPPHVHIISRLMCFVSAASALQTVEEIDNLLRLVRRIEITGELPPEDSGWR